MASWGRSSTISSRASVDCEGLGGVSASALLSDGVGSCVDSEDDMDGSGVVATSIKDRIGEGFAVGLAVVTRSPVLVTRVRVSAPWMTLCFFSLAALSFFNTVALRFGAIEYEDRQEHGLME